MKMLSLRIFFLILILFLTFHTSYGTLTQLKQQIELLNSQESSTGEHQQVQHESNESPIESRIEHILESSTSLHNLQLQIASVTRTLDQYLNQHTNEAELLTGDHDQIGNLTQTLQRLLAAQKELDERHTRQHEIDHSTLIQLIEQQQQQSKLLQQEIDHSKMIQSELTRLKEEQDSLVNQRMAAQELEATHHRIGSVSSTFSHIPLNEPNNDLQQHEQESFMDANESMGDESFMEVSSSTQTPHQHDEHDIDLAHTMDHSSLSELEAEEQARELESENALGHAAAEASLMSFSEQQSQSQVDPSKYASSAAYLAAMNSADAAEYLSPQQQLQYFGDGDESADQIGMPHNKNGLHSMSEIDSLVAEGATESSEHDDMSDFEPSSNSHNPALAHVLGSLQNEESIEKAMLSAQAKVKAIAAELEKHQHENGNDQSQIEIDLMNESPNTEHEETSNESDENRLHEQTEV